MAGKAHRSGGARPGAGRPRSSKPRCACDKHTLDHARKNRLKCGRRGSVPSDSIFWKKIIDLLEKNYRRARNHASTSPPAATAISGTAEPSPTDDRSTVEAVKELRSGATDASSGLRGAAAPSDESGASGS